MAKQNFGGVYANMDFPPYVWTEYPKHVPTGANGKYEVAFNEADEERILAKLQKTEDDAPAKVEPYVADPEKEILISRARELQVPFNPKWSKAKLERIVQEAEDEVDALPVETTAKKLDEVTSEEDKDELIARAKALGIPANRLWGVPRLLTMIADKEASKRKE